MRQRFLKFKEIWSVADNKRVQGKVLGHFAINPAMTLRQGSGITGICHQSVCQVIKLNHFYSYKMQIFQKLCEDDPDRRIQFCEKMTDKLRTYYSWDAKKYFV